jgi:hypothetical protein
MAQANSYLVTDISFSRARKRTSEYAQSLKGRGSKYVEWLNSGEDNAVVCIRGGSEERGRVLWGRDELVLENQGFQSIVD